MSVSWISIPQISERVLRKRLHRLFWARTNLIWKTRFGSSDLRGDMVGLCSRERNQITHFLSYSLDISGFDKSSTPKKYSKKWFYLQYVSIILSGNDHRRKIFKLLSVFHFSHKSISETIKKTLHQYLHYRSATHIVCYTIKCTNIFSNKLLRCKLKKKN